MVEKDHSHLRTSIVAQELTSAGKATNVGCLGAMRQSVGAAQRVAVTGKLWLVQSPQEPVKVAVKSALRVSGPV